MLNPNTRNFWNKKIIEQEQILLDSPIYQKKLEVVSRYLSKFKGKLLDAGVGYGHLEDRLKLKEDFKWYGIDISDISVKKLKRKIKGIFKTSSLLKLPFKNDFFDGLLLLDVLEHFSKKEIEIVFKEVGRVLSVGGVLIISVPINEDVRDSKTNRHLTNFTVNSLVDLLHSNGYKVDKMRSYAAFRKLFEVKNFVNSFLKIKKDNLLILKAIKK